CQQSYNAPYSF
nr:immunoglobulin light chain junction region [Macaca mulatta]